jgi:hypothetical protein
MQKEQSLAIFEKFKIRKSFDEKTQKWFFSVIDIVAVLTDQNDPVKANNYWRKLKQRLKEEGSETVTNCHSLKMEAIDGKMRLTDVADLETNLKK